MTGDRKSNPQPDPNKGHVENQDNARRPDRPEEEVHGEGTGKVERDRMDRGPSRSQ